MTERPSSSLAFAAACVATFVAWAVAAHAAPSTPPSLHLHAAGTADAQARLEFAWPAEFGAWYEIERSSDLRAWSAVDTRPVRAHLARQQRELDYTPAVASAEGVTIWVSPQRSADPRTGGGDPVIAALSDFVAGPGAAIHVAMAFWSDARPAIAHRLVELRRAGAQVRVIVAPDGTGASIFEILAAGGVEVTRHDGVHSKYMLVHSMPQRRARRLVYAGSHNYTSPALRSNDESLLRLDDDALYEAFLADWQRLRAHPLAR